MRKVFLYFFLLLLLSQCLKEDDFTNYRVVRVPGEGTLLSQNGAYLQSKLKDDKFVFVEPDRIMLKSTYVHRDTAATLVYFGHCWVAANSKDARKTVFPTISDTTINYVYNKSIDGADSVAYVDTLSKLVYVTRYYVRSFLITSSLKLDQRTFSQVLTDIKNGVKGIHIGYANAVIDTLTPAYENVWLLKRSSGFGTTGASAFWIAKKGYVVGGSDGTSYLKRLLQYDQETGTWQQMTDLPNNSPAEPTNPYFGGGRKHGVAIATLTRGYYGLGQGELNVGGRPVDQLKYDWWEYDPTKNSWAERLSFPGGARKGAVGFPAKKSGNIYCYVGLGDGGSLNPIYKNDMWEYDPKGNVWVAKAPFIGEKRAYAIGVGTVDVPETESLGFVGLGKIGTNSYKDDFWYFNPNTNVWVAVADFPSSKRQSSVGFALKNQVYVGCGYNGSYFKDFWHFDPAGSQGGKWKRIADYPGNAMMDGVGLSIPKNDTIVWGYVGFGTDTVKNISREFYEYLPGK